MISLSNPLPSISPSIKSPNKKITVNKLHGHFSKAHPDFETGGEFSSHDLFSHILGGGLTTPKGEVFGELMELVLSTAQKNWYPSPKQKAFLNDSFFSRLFPDYSKKLAQTELNVSLPDFNRLIKERDEWEAQYIADGDMTANEKLSTEETQEIYDYATQLLGIYIEQWGVTKYFNILGQFNGQKGGNYIAPKHYKKEI